jgi:hypothetical protein
MTVMYCDITGKEIEYATTGYSWRTRGRQYIAIQGRDLSLEGLQKLDSEVYNQMSQSERFSFKAYKKALSTKINELTN